MEGTTRLGPQLIWFGDQAWAATESRPYKLFPPYRIFVGVALRGHPFVDFYESL